MRLLISFLVCLLCSLTQAQVIPIQKTVFTTNLFAAPVLSGSIPYYDFANGKFVGTPLAYTNGFVFEPSLGFLSVFHTNTTGDPLLNLQEGGIAGPSIQGYSDRFVAANTNLNLDAVGPYSVRLRVNGGNIVEAGASGMSLVGKTNIVSDDDVGLTYNGSRIAALQTLYYGGLYGFSSSSIMPTNIRSGILAAGTNDLFTVPAGKRFIANTVQLSSTNLTSVTAFMMLRTNGTLYRYAINSSVATNSPSGISVSGDNFLFEGGDTITISNSLAGVNATVTGYLFPTNIAAYSPRLMSLAATTNTLYTCPAGKCAVNMTLPQALNVGGVPMFGQYVNSSGAARTVAIYAVPSGGVAGSSNIVLQRSVADLAATSIQPLILFPGDSIVISTDSATAVQWARITVVEIPFP